MIKTDTMDGQYHVEKFTIEGDMIELLLASNDRPRVKRMMFAVPRADFAKMLTSTIPTDFTKLNVSQMRKDEACGDTPEETER